MSGTILGPFLLPLGAIRFQAMRHIGTLLKLFVLLASFNTVYGLQGCLYSASCTDPRRIGELLQESIVVEFWAAFPLQAALAVVAVTAIPRPELRPRLSDYGLVTLVTANVLLLYWFVSFVLSSI